VTNDERSADLINEGENIDVAISERGRVEEKGREGGGFLKGEKKKEGLILYHPEAAQDGEWVSLLSWGKTAGVSLQGTEGGAPMGGGHRQERKGAYGDRTTYSPRFFFHRGEERRGKKENLPSPEVKKKKGEKKLMAWKILGEKKRKGGRTPHLHLASRRNSGELFSRCDGEEGYAGLWHSAQGRNAS